MNKRYPFIRYKDESREAWIHLGLRFDFYMRCLHTQMRDAVHQVMETYIHASAPATLNLYLDDEGYWQELDTEGHSIVRSKVWEDRFPRILLSEEASSESPSLHHLEYYGQRRVDVPEWQSSDKKACVASFWLSPEYLKAHGPERVRALALELAAPLPWCSGNGGFALSAPIQGAGITRHVYEQCPRYPGLDIPGVDRFARNIGTRIRGPSWLTFVGQPVLGELGGVDALRSRLHSPGTTVQALPGDRAVATLGEWPEAGDRELGLTLPAYRELARVLEPWLYLEHNLPPDFPPDALRQWERRFLD